MKKIFGFIAFIITTGVMLMGLYILDLPPFTPKEKNVTQSQSERSQNEVSDTTTTPTSKVVRGKNYEEQMLKGNLYEKNGNHSQALKAYEIAVEIDPNTIDPLREMGRIYLRTKDYLRATVSFEKALALKPQDTELKVYLTRALIGNRKISEAKDIINTVSEDNQLSSYYKGVLAAYAGNYDESKKYFSTTLSLNTDKITSQKADNFMKAYEEYTANQGSPSLHLKTLLGRSMNQTGEYQIAIPVLYQVVNEKKDYRDAWILLGYSYLNIEKYEDATEAFKTAKKLDPEKPDTYFYLGLTYYANNQLEEAAQNLELAKKFHFPEAVWVDQKLAEIYLQLKKYDKSAENYENVVSINTDNAHFFIKPVWIYIDRLQEPEKAVEIAKKAVYQHPDDAMSYNLLGWALLAVGDTEGSEKSLIIARNLNPNLDAVSLNFGMLYEKKGEKEKALTWYQDAFKQGKGNSISTVAAERYNQLVGKSKDLEYDTIKATVLTP